MHSLESLDKTYKAAEDTENKPGVCYIGTSWSPDWQTSITLALINLSFPCIHPSILSLSKLIWLVITFPIRRDTFGALFNKLWQWSWRLYQNALWNKYADFFHRVAITRLIIRLWTLIIFVHLEAPPGPFLNPLIYLFHKNHISLYSSTHTHTHTAPAIW